MEASADSSGSLAERGSPSGNPSRAEPSGRVRTIDSGNVSGITRRADTPCQDCDSRLTIVSWLSLHTTHRGKAWMNDAALLLDVSSTPRHATRSRSSARRVGFAAGLVLATLRPAVVPAAAEEQEPVAARIARVHLPSVDTFLSL